MTQYDSTLKYTPEFLRGMTADQLELFLLAARRAGLELRAQNQLSGAVPPDIRKKIGRDIARILTIINERK